MKKFLMLVIVGVFAAASFGAFTEDFESYSPAGEVSPPTGNLNDTGAKANGWYGSNFAQYNRITLVDTHSSPWQSSGGGTNSAALVKATGASEDSHLFNYFDDRSAYGVTGSMGKNLTQASGILGFSWDFYMTNVANDRPYFGIFGDGGVNLSDRAIHLDIGWLSGSDYNFRTYDGTTAVTSGATLAVANEWYRVIVSNVDIESKTYDLELLRWDSGNQTSIMYHEGLGFYSTTASTSSLAQFRAHTSSNTATRVYYVDNFHITQDSPPVAADNPVPGNGADYVGIDGITLSWASYPGATASRVYFGTTPQLDAPGDYKGQQAGETYALGTLDTNTTYYWRIDQVYDGDTFTGILWSFTTASSLALNDMYTEYFEDFGLGVIDSQFGWGGDAVVSNAWSIVKTSGSGQYAAGQGVSVKSNNVWMTLGLSNSAYRIPIVSGTNRLEMSMDVRLNQNAGINFMMRFGSPEFGPMFGYMLDGSVQKFWAREANLGAQTFGAQVSASNGDWLRMSLIYDMTTGRGDVIAYNLTTGVPVATGLSDIDLGLWSGSKVGLVFRHHSSSETLIDNLRLMAYRPMTRYSIPADSVTGIGTATGTGIDDMPTLSWTSFADTDYSSVYPYSGSVSEQLYFGTSPESLSFEANVTGSQYNLPYILDMATTYYWRVDTTIDGIVYMGQTWQFTTDMPKAHNPVPADGGGVAPGSPVLSWTSFKDFASYGGEISQTVYFGDSPATLAFAADVSSSEYEVASVLDELTTYYWRVDTTIGSDTYEGDIWSFTTGAQPLNYPRKLAYEGFDYATGTLGTKGTGGDGWASIWQRGFDGTCPLNIGQGSLSSGMDYILGTKANRVWAIGTKYSADYHGGVRQLEYPINMAADQDYYISYLVMCDNNAFNQVSLWVREAKTGGNVLLAVHQYEAGHHATYVPTPKFSLRSPANDWYNRVFGTWDSGEVYMVVVKITATAAGSDTVSVKMFSQSTPLPIDEPSSWDASFTIQSDLSYSWIQIDGVGDQYDLWNVDEIHIGTGWGAVTGWAQVCGDFGTIMEWDFNEDCQVDFEDYAVLAADWLRCTDPAIEGCEWAIDDSDPNFASLFTALPAEQTNVYEASGITVDGNLGDWTGSRWYNARFTSGYNLENASDIIEAKLALKWLPSSPDKVYLAVKVKDTNQSIAEAPTAWNDGDNIEVRFTVNDTSTSVAWFPDTFDTAQLYQVFPLDGGGSYANLGSIITARDAGTYTDLEYAVSIDGDYILYEMAMPAYTAYNIGSQSGTTASLSDGDVIAFNIQINTVNGEVAGALFNNQGNNPNADWAKFTITANSSLELGDMGYFATDLDKSGVVGLSDLDFIINRWLSCTDPEIEGCDQPWMP